MYRENKIISVMSMLRGKLHSDDIKTFLLAIIFLYCRNKEFLKDLIAMPSEAIWELFERERAEAELDLEEFNLLKIISELDRITISNVLLEMMEIEESMVAELFIWLVPEKHNRFIGDVEFYARNIVSAIADVGDKQSILNPNIQSGYLFDEILKENPFQYIVGETTDVMMINFLKIRMYCIGAKNVKLFHGDSLVNPLYITKSEELEKFDRVITMPPIGVRDSGIVLEGLENDFYYRFPFGLPPKSSLDWGYISNGISALADDGKGVFVVSNSALMMGGAAATIRRNLLKFDWIESVIALPTKMTQSMAILVINKKKPKKLDGKICMINASNFALVRNKVREWELSKDEINKIANAYFSDNEESGFVENISNKKILENDGILSVTNYVVGNKFELSRDLSIQINQEKWSALEKISLEEIATIHRGFNITTKDEKIDGAYRFIKISDIVKGKIDFEGLTKGDVQKAVKAENYQIHEGDILLSVRGTVDKMALITENIEEVLFSQNLVCIRPKRDKVNSRWLYEYLTSPVGLAQISIARVGTTIAQIPRKNLAQLKIPLISVEQQKKSVNQYEEKRIKIEEAMKKLEEQHQMVQMELYDEMGIYDVYSVLIEDKKKKEE